jgi:hypothetical protein
MKNLLILSVGRYLGKRSHAKPHHVRYTKCNFWGFHEGQMSLYVGVSQLSTLFKWAPIYRAYQETSNEALHALRWNNRSNSYIQPSGRPITVRGTIAHRIPRSVVPIGAGLRIQPSG